MKKNVIYLESSESMAGVPDESVDLFVTSPPYNINIKYGNKTSHGKTVESKSTKYTDNLPEEERKVYFSKFVSDLEVLVADENVEAKVHLVKMFELYKKFYRRISE